LDCNRSEGFIFSGDIFSGEPGLHGLRARRAPRAPRKKNPVILTTGSVH
jgi:hypothetical protein